MKKIVNLDNLRRVYAETNRDSSQSFAVCIYRPWKDVKGTTYKWDPYRYCETLAEAVKIANKLKLEGKTKRVQITASVDKVIFEE